MLIFAPLCFLGIILMANKPRFRASQRWRIHLPKRFCDTASLGNLPNGAKPLKVIRLWVVFLALTVTGANGVWADGGTAGLSATKPRLVFSDAEMRLAKKVAGDPALASFYGSNGLQPIFQGPQAALRREALIAAVSQADAHGLPAGRYGRDTLEIRHKAGALELEDELVFALAFKRWTHDLSGGLLDPRRIDPNNQRQVLRRPTDALLHEYQAATDPAGMLENLAPQDPRYKILQAALRKGSDLIAPPTLPLVEQAVWREGTQSQSIGHMRARLAAVGFPSGGAGVTDGYFDSSLLQAVKAYQERVGLAADGVAGPQTIAMLNRQQAQQNRDILISLERMRWLAGHDLNARHVWVNLPQFNAEIRENGVTSFETRVVVGKSGEDYRTPEFSDQIEYMVVNPRWNVPRSITVRDYLPRLKANRNAVSHIDVVDGNGNVVPRNQIDFGRYTAQNFPYRMRQKPSDDNALGLVKFMFPNPWNIYLHDTPTKHLFSQSSRAYSHGCIRIGKPFDLAYHLLRDTVEDPQARFQRALDGGKETWLHLKQDVPVHLVYFTAFPDDSGKIRHYRDIYSRDELVIAAFERAALEVFPR